MWRYEGGYLDIYLLPFLSTIIPFSLSLSWLLAGERSFSSPSPPSRSRYFLNLFFLCSSDNTQEGFIPVVMHF